MTAPRRWLSLLLGLVVSSACECGGGDGGFQQLVPLLSPDAARVAMPDLYVGATKEATLRFHSTGTGAVEVAAVRLEDASAGGFAIVDEGHDALPPGATLEVRVSYAPVAEGPARVDVVVESDAENAPTRTTLEVTALPPLDCGASTTCQRRTFDADAGACVIEDLAGPCDDGNACTEDDVCFEGACVGSAVTCPSPHECTQGLCDADTGCVLLAHDDRCEDDGNPCTAERCDVEDGCVREELPDGTICGGVTMCASAALCYQGACTVFDVPDGTPCSDGDFCTVDDRCSGGECSGTRVEQEPAIAGEVRMFGTEAGTAALLSGGRAVFFDPHTSRGRVGGSYSATAPDGGMIATVVEVQEGALEVLAVTDLPDEPVPAAAMEVSPGVVVGFTRWGDPTAGWVPRRLEIAPDGSVVAAAVGEEPSTDLGTVAAPLPDGRVVVRGEANRLWLLDPSDFSREFLADLPFETEEAGEISVVELEAFAGGVAVVDEHGLHFVSEAGVVQPLGEDLGATSANGIDSNDDVLAVLWRDGTSTAGVVQVVFYDAALDEIARLPLDQDAGRIALDDGLLVVGRAGPALAYDVSDPESPVLLSGSLPWSATSVDRLDAREGLALFTGRVTVSTGPGSSSILATVDDGGLGFLLHPQLGTPGALVSLGDEVLAAAKTSFHRLDVSVSGAPLVLEGSLLARPFEAAGSRWLPLVRKSGSAVLPHGGSALQMDSSLWLYDLTLPIVPPFPQRTLTFQIRGLVATSSTLLVALEQSGPAPPATLKIFDAASTPPAEMAVFPPLSETPLLWSLEGTEAGWYPAVAIDEAGHVVVVSEPTEELPQRVELLLFDATVPEAPVLSGRGLVELPEAQLPTGRLAVAIAGRAIAITALGRDTVIVLQHLPDGSVVETLRFPSEAFQPLGFDGRTLILSRAGTRELEFWDVSGAAAIDLGVVTLPDEAVALVSYADTLLVSGQSSFVTLEPPCPPLP